MDSPFSGVTNSGRVWRKVPESDARSVGQLSYATEGRSTLYVRRRGQRPPKGLGTNVTVEAT